MKVSPLEIRSHPLKKSLVGGCDAREVELFREMAATALEESAREISSLEEKLRDASARLDGLIENETALKDALTTAQRIMDDIRANARKEAELIIAEAGVHGDEIVRQAQNRAQELGQDIYRLKHQRLELESSIKAVLDYHTSKLLIDEVDAKRADENANKVRFLPK